MKNGIKFMVLLLLLLWNKSIYSQLSFSQGKIINTNVGIHSINESRNDPFNYRGDSFYTRAYFQRVSYLDKDSISKRRFPRVSLLLGYHQWAYGGAEIGLSRCVLKGHIYTGRNSAGLDHLVSNTWSISSEVSNISGITAGVKISYWRRTLNTGPLLFGGSAIVCTDFDQSAAVIRPEIGIALIRLDKHLAKIELPYNYNIRLSIGYNLGTGSQLPLINKPVVSLIVYKEANLNTATVLH